MKRKDMKLLMNGFPLLTSSQKCDTTNYRNQSSVFAESENAFMNIRGDGPRAKTSILALTAMNQFSDDFMYLQYTYGRSVFQSLKHLLLCTPQTLNVQQQTVKITSYGMWSNTNVQSLLVADTVKYELRAWCRCPTESCDFWEEWLRRGRTATHESIMKSRLGCNHGNSDTMETPGSPVTQGPLRPVYPGIGSSPIHHGQ